MRSSMNCNSTELRRLKRAAGSFYRVCREFAPFFRLMHDRNTGLRQQHHERKCFAVNRRGV